MNFLRTIFKRDDVAVGDRMTEHHVVYHVVGRHWLTGLPKYSYEPTSDSKSENIFYVIVSMDRGRKMFYTNDANNKGMYSKRPYDAVFFLDRMAAEETLPVARNKKHKKILVCGIELDLKNALPEAMFVIICEDRVNGKLHFFKKVNRGIKKVITAEKSTKARTLHFRACLAVLEELRAFYKRYKYSMVPLDVFDVEVKSSEILGFLRRNPPKTSIALSFKL